MSEENKKMSFVMGIDPGLRGAVVVLELADRVKPIAEVMPETLQEFILLVRNYAKMAQLGECSFQCFIEKAQVMLIDGRPKAGLSATFNYGRHFGELLGVLASYRVSHTQVPPNAWTRVMHLGTKDAPPKERSLEAARRLFPTVPLVVGQRARKPHDGIVDALLIAEFGRRQLGCG